MDRGNDEGGETHDLEDYAAVVGSEVQRRWGIDSLAWAGAGTGGGLGGCGCGCGCGGVGLDIAGLMQGKLHPAGFF